MKSIGRIGLLAVLSAVASAVAVFVVATPGAGAAPPPDVTPIKVAAVGVQGGNLVYLRGQNANLYWRTVEDFATPGYSTDWRIIPGGQVGSGPDAARIDGDTVVLAAMATDRSVLVRQQDGPSFGPWENLGGTVTSAPVLYYSDMSASLIVVARGTDGAVWYRFSTSGGPWTPWRSIGGVVTAAPDAVEGSSPTQLAVFGRGTNGNLYRRVITGGGWGPWQHLGIPINSAVSTVQPFEQPTYFYRNAARHVVRHTPSGRVDIGGLVISSPDTAEGHLVAAVGTNRALYVWTEADGWRYLAGIAA